MNIKNIKEYARKSNLSGWTKYKLDNARSYDDVKDTFIGEIWTAENILLNFPHEQNKIYEERIQQARNILRLS